MWWSVMKLTGGLFLRLAIALIAVADVFMFLLLYTNGIADPAPRGESASTYQMGLPLPETEGDWQNDFPRPVATAKVADTDYSRVPGPVLAQRKEPMYVAAKTPSKTVPQSVCGPGGGSHAASTAQGKGRLALPMQRL